MATSKINKYKHWLISKVDTNGDFSLDSYNNLMDILFETDFFYIKNDPQTKMDKNRSSDGIYLRTIYCDETGNYIEDDISDKNVSVLEVLVALSIRIEQDIMGTGGNDFGHWFVEMLDNLGLLSYDDDNFVDDKRINDILNDFMYRRYGEDGVGSLFPLKNPEICSDSFENLEIWDQMQYYLNENYD